MKVNLIIAIIVAGVAIASIAFLIPSFTEDTFTNMNMDRKLGTVDTTLGSPLLGSTSAPVTIIEFGDYQCSNCKRWFLETKPTIKENLIDTGKVNLVFVDIAFLGKDSLPASAATYCAEDQQKYWDYNSFLYSNQLGVDNGWANVDSLKGYAFNLGLDMDLFVSCIDSGKYDNRVQKNTDESIRNGVKGTPTFFIIGPDGQQETIVGPQPYDVFKRVIDSMI